MSEYESERTASRAEAARILRGLADGVAAGTVQFDDCDEAIAVGVPESVRLEVEVETEDDARSLEVELDWPTAEVDEPSAVDAREEAPAEEAPTDDAPSIGPGELPESLARFELFEDRSGEWRWRLVHRNGNVIATSGEGYTRKHNARKGLRSVMRNSPGAEVVDESDR